MNLKTLLFTIIITIIPSCIDSSTGTSNASASVSASASVNAAAEPQRPPPPPPHLQGKQQQQQHYEQPPQSQSQQYQNKPIQRQQRNQLQEHQLRRQNQHPNPNHLPPPPQSLMGQGKGMEKETLDVMEEKEEKSDTIQKVQKKQIFQKIKEVVEGDGHGDKGEVTEKKKVKDDETTPNRIEDMGDEKRKGTSAIGEGNEKEESDWIIPSQQNGNQQQTWDRMEQDRLRQQRPPPPPAGSSSQHGRYQQQQQQQQQHQRNAPNDRHHPQSRPFPNQQHQQQYQQRQPQRGPPSPQQRPPYQQMAPRNYDYNRRPPQHQQQFQRPPHPQGGQRPLHPHQRPPYHPQQQQQQQQYQNALVPHRPGSPPPLQHHQNQNQQQNNPSSILKRITNQSINTLSDIDNTIIQKSSQVASGLTSNVSGMFRKTLFNIEGSYTNLKNNLKDNVNNVVSTGLFGVGGTSGAPTSSNDATSTWENDRRKTVVNERRKRMGLEKDNGDDKDVAGSNPLQDFLNSGGQVVTPNVNENVEDPLQNQNQEQQQPPQQHPNVVMEEELEKSTDDGWGSSTTDEGEVLPQRDYHPQQGQGQPQVGDTGVKEQNENENISDVNYQGVDDRGISDTSGISTSTGSSTSPYAPRPYSSSFQKDENDDHHRAKANIIQDVDPASFFIPKQPSSTSKTSTLQKTPKPSPRSSFSFDDDEPSKNKIGSVMRSMTSSLPQVRLPLPRRRSSGMDSDWSDDEEWTKKKSKIIKKSSPTKVNQKKKDGQEEGSFQVFDLLDRRKRMSLVARKDTFNLLSSIDMKKVSSIGRDKAVLDLMTLVFTIISTRELKDIASKFFIREDIILPVTWVDSKDFLQSILSGVSMTDLQDLLSSWAPHTLAAAILSQFTIYFLYNKKVLNQALKLSQNVGSNIQASQLYLRLVSGLTTKPQLPGILGSAARDQFIGAVEIARLGSFGFMALVLILATTVSVLKPLSTSIISTFVEISSLSTLREWPVDWESLGGSLKDLIIPLGHNLVDLLKDEVNKVVDNPMTIASTAFLCVSLVAVTQIPTIERRRVSLAATNARDKALNGHEAKEARSIEAILNTGISSASRLQLQSNDGAIDESILRWNVLKNSLSRLKQKEVTSSNHLIVEKLGYLILTSVLLLAPIVVHFVLSHMSDTAQFNFLNEILLLIFMHGATRRAVFTGLKSSKDASVVGTFMGQLLSTTSEVDTTMMRNPHNDVHLSATASPMKGITVSDLWAAHVTKRAWACRKANLTCNSGEVVLILGDDSSGKTRLLTAISETIVTPPKRSRSTTLARGKVIVGGLDTTKWEKSQLKRKVGILLNDARTLADVSHLYSGVRLATILQPICPNVPKPLRASIYGSAVSLASKLSGISTTLIPRLPSKLSTIVTANEDELSKNSELHTMSAAEWSKIHLTKVLAQAIACNDNPLSSPNAVPRCLVGSILLLDDATTYMDEVDEAQLIKELRSSGAATVMTSRRWALGRFVDRVVVMKNGSVVESGTHEELLSKGSQHSAYAKKWAQITSS